MGSYRLARESRGVGVAPGGRRRQQVVALREAATRAHAGTGHVDVGARRHSTPVDGRNWAQRHACTSALLFTRSF